MKNPLLSPFQGLAVFHLKLAKEQLYKRPDVSSAHTSEAAFYLETLPWIIALLLIGLVSSMIVYLLWKRRGAALSLQSDAISPNGIWHAAALWLGDEPHVDYRN